MKNSNRKTLTSSKLSCVIDLISVPVPSGPSEYLSFFFCWLD
jgi:hypothetical protein